MGQAWENPLCIGGDGIGVLGNVLAGAEVRALSKNRTEPCETLGEPWHFCILTPGYQEKSPMISTVYESSCLYFVL